MPPNNAEKLEKKIENIPAIPYSNSSVVLFLANSEAVDNKFDVIVDNEKPLLIITKTEKNNAEIIDNT